MDKVAITDIREEVKRYIDHADEKTVKMAHAMLEVDAATDDWWEALPDNVRSDVEDALLQADRGEIMDHEQVKKKYPQWFTR